jgi:hypothetical protein
LQSDLIGLSLLSNGIISNAASIAYTLGRLSQEERWALNEGTTFLSGEGNALLLIANESELLQRLDSLIETVRIREEISIPVFIVLLCRRSQLMDHAIEYAMAVSPSSGLSFNY